MDTQSDEVNPALPPVAPEIPDWIPPSGIQLRKAGVQFDAVRVDGDPGRTVADRLARATGGNPGPVVEEARGRRAVYFLVPVPAAPPTARGRPASPASPRARTTSRTSRCPPWVA